MKQDRNEFTRAATLLLAAAALPLIPAVAQDNTVAPSPPVVTPTPSPTPPAAATPAPVQPPRVTAPPVTDTTPPAAEIAPEPEAAATPPARRERRTVRARPAERAETPAPVAPAVEPAPPTPVAETLPEPVAVPDEAAPAETAETTENIATRELAGLPLWAWLLAGVAAIAAIAALLFGRRRRDDFDEPAYRDSAHVAESAAAYEPEAIASPEPQPGFAAPPVVAAIEPELETEPEIVPDRPAPVAHRESIVSDPLRYVAAAPVLGAAAAAVSAPAAPDPVVEAGPLEEADAGDVAALAAASTPAAEGPWLELLMRPIRAGTNATDAVVEFELTVGNTGSAAAEDVRVSTWMFAAGTAQESEMERLLIDPPAEARLGEISIEPGDGAKLEATVALPREGLDGSVLPVVVADARYALPGGGEGRVSASFAVGLAHGDDIGPFPLDRDPSLTDAIGARLHGELTRS